MSFRTRLALLALLAVVVPLGMLALGVRAGIEHRLTAREQDDMAASVRFVREHFEGETATLASRLALIRTTLLTDDGFRLAALHGDTRYQRYAIGWAPDVMPLAGLTLLRIHDDSGRIVSSGHFRNEYGVPHGDVLRRMPARSPRPQLMEVSTPDGAMIALVALDTVSLGGRRFTIVGGVGVNQDFLRHVGRGAAADVSLHRDIAPHRASGYSVALELPLVRERDGHIQLAALGVLPWRSDLTLLRRDADAWIAGAFASAAAAIVLLVLWMAHAITRPLTVLADAALAIDFATDRVDAVAARSDEIGTLGRRLSATARRLQANAEHLRVAERRATVGEMARQVHHDVRNGLVPIRNVLRHLTQVLETSPSELAAIYREREHTLHASVGYLEELATRWARLSPRTERRAVDLNAIVRDAIAAAEAGGAARIARDLDGRLPATIGDPIALRRIVDNLLANALQSLSHEGEVRVATRGSERSVRLTVADTGRGMSPDERRRALAGYYTTKPRGLGLGLSVVRRLVADHGGHLTLESAIGRGTTVSVDLPQHPLGP